MPSGKSQSWLPLQFEFLSGLPEQARRRRVLLTIQAYIDDSGVKGTDPVFVLAGFIGRAEKWASFSDDWKRHLEEKPSIKYLKMNEAAKLDGEFRYWTGVERDKKLKGFSEVIKRFLPDKGIYLLNDLIAWQQIITNPVKMLADPHFMAFHAMIGAICNEVLDSGVNEQVEIIFDEHVIFGPRVAHWYPVTKEMIQTSKNKRINAISHLLPPYPMFRDDKHFVPLQAADILAWLLRNAFMDRLPGLETAWHPKKTGFEWLAADLLPHIPPSQHSSIWGDEQIARIQKLTREMEVAPELLSKWRKQLGIDLDKPRKKHKKH